MTHTYSKLLVHFVWSTKQRALWIEPALKNRIYALIRKLFENEGGKVIIINGMPDHIHILACLKPSTVISELIRTVKGASSKWIRDNLERFTNFSWQEGYGAFSVGYSNVQSVISYIANQEHHHKHKSYDDEFIELLNMQNIDFDERFVLG